MSREQNPEVRTQNSEVRIQNSGRARPPARCILSAMPRPSLLAFALLASTALAHAQWPRVASSKLPRYFRWQSEPQRSRTAHRRRQARSFRRLGNVRRGRQSQAPPQPGERSQTRRRRLPPVGRSHLQGARREQRQGTTPGAQCLPSGIPEKDTVPHPYKIVQTPGLIVVLYEARTIYRQIFTRRPLAPARSQPCLARAIQLGIGTATRWWWKRPASTARPGSICPAIPLLRRCTSPSASPAATLGHKDIQFTINDPQGLLEAMDRGRQSPSSAAG